MAPLDDQRRAARRVASERAAAMEQQGVNAFGERRWREQGIVQEHRRRQTVAKGYGYRDVMDTRRQLRVIDRAVSEGVIEDWTGEVDDVGQPVALTDFTRSTLVPGSRRSLRDFEALPETYDQALDALIRKRRGST